MSFKIPKPFEEQPFTPYIWDLPGIVGIVSDIHFPYHDPAALQAAIDKIEKESKKRNRKISAFLINGDGIDCYDLSDYLKSPGKPSYLEECQMMSQFLGSLRKRFKRTKLFYKLGNHEYRVQRYLMTRAPGLHSEANSIEVMTECKKHNVEVIDDKRVIWLGNQAVVHGHELGESRSSPISPAKALFDKTCCDSLAGHHHRSSVFTKKSLSGHIFRAFTTGCLSQLTPEYRRHNQYNHGFAITEIMKDGVEFHCDNYTIENGVVL